MASIKLKHTSGNGTIIHSPAANPSSDVTLKLPSTTGSAGQVLKVASANHSSTNAELEFGADASGKVLQVVYFNKTDASSMSMTETWTDVTGYSLSITPTAANSKIILQGQINYNCNDHYTYGKFVRSINSGSYADVTDWIGDTASNRIRSMTGSMKDYDSYRNAPMAIYAVDDTHNTTNAITYKLQFRGSFTHLGIYGYFNRSEADSDNNNGGRAVSHLTLTEVAA